jgi:hypothetical protein
MLNNQYSLGWFKGDHPGSAVAQQIAATKNREDRCAVSLQKNRVELPRRLKPARH